MQYVRKLPIKLITDSMNELLNIYVPVILICQLIKFWSLMKLNAYSVCHVVSEINIIIYYSLFQYV